MRLTLEEGARLVGIVREALDLYLRSGQVKRPDVSGGRLMEPRGVFCTLKSHPSDELRGCTGLPYAEKPLSEATVAAALSSANDPRFPPFQLGELSSVTIEISVLTNPEEVQVRRREDYPSAVEPGKDGLILRYGLHTGLFLPQVWETVPDPEEFLGALCHKAGLVDSEAWKDEGATLYRFGAQVFRERQPGGEVVEET